VGTLRITTDGGTFAIPLSGVGQSKVPKLQITPAVLTFAPVVMGNVSTETVTITNVSDAPMTLTGIVPPAPPFSLSGLPEAGATLDAGASFIATIAYAPTMTGTSSGYLSFAAGDAVAALAVEGSALTGGRLRIAPQTIDVGSDIVGDVSTAVFQLTNDGDVALVIEKSKPPTSPAFQAIDPFDEGTVIAPGASLEQLVRVSPAAVGPNTDVWQLNANDGQGLRLVTFTINGVAPPAPAAATPVSTPASAATPTATPLTSGRGAGASDAQNATVVGGCSLGGTPGRAPFGLALAALAVVALRRRR
jgi:MYXO-CTERM domain-containing protein